MNKARLWMEVKDWKEAVLSGESPPQEFALQKSEVFETPVVLEGPDASRTIRFVVSRATPDRDLDTINQNGWDLANFKRNPVVPFAHDYSSLPVAKAVSIGVEGNDLVSVAEFPTREVHAFGDTVFNLVKGGFLNAVSVGFIPKSHEVNKDRGGFDFLKQELLEYSVVPIPSNPDALVQARAAGVNMHPLKQWAEKTLDEYNAEVGIWIPRTQFEKLFHMTKDGVAVKTIFDENGMVREPAHGETTTDAGTPSEAETETTPEARTDGEGETAEESCVVEGAAEVTVEDSSLSAGNGHEHDPETETCEGCDGDPEAQPVAAELNGPVTQKEVVQKLNPSVLDTPLPGSYEWTTIQLRGSAPNFLTRNNKPFRDGMDVAIVFATFQDRALVAVIGRDRSFDDDPVFQGSFSISAETGMPQWTGEPKQVEVQVSAQIVAAHLAVTNFTKEGVEPDEGAAAAEEGVTKNVPLTKEEKNDITLKEYDEVVLNALNHQLGSIVQASVDQAIRRAKGRLD